tara:strand:+ start:1847 stop:2239 length:393 start_codon:yes stop_codon:yes gene_type:complete
MHHSQNLNQNLKFKFWNNDYTYDLINKIISIKDSVYLYYIRYRIYNLKSPSDLINLLQSLSNKKENTDYLLNLLTNCFKKYPLSENELQKISQWQQLYQFDNGIYSFTTITLWISIISSIQERESLKLIK